MITAYERTKLWRKANPEKAREHRNAAYQRNKDKERAQQQAYDLTPKGRFVAHKKNARRRGVEFDMSFDEWWTIWESHWDGRGMGKLVMCRTCDEGAYEVGNVRIDSQSNNAKEQHDVRKSFESQ
jgi:hypothetical protein